MLQSLVEAYDLPIGTIHQVKNGDYLFERANLRRPMDGYSDTVAFAIAANSQTIPECMNFDSAMIVYEGSGVLRVNTVFYMYKADMLIQLPKGAWVEFKRVDSNTFFLQMY